MAKKRTLALRPIANLIGAYIYGNCKGLSNARTQSQIKEALASLPNLSVDTKQKLTELRAKDFRACVLMLRKDIAGSYPFIASQTTGRSMGYYVPRSYEEFAPCVRSLCRRLRTQQETIIALTATGANILGRIYKQGFINPYEPLPKELKPPQKIELLRQLYRLLMPVFNTLTSGDKSDDNIEKAFAAAFVAISQFLSDSSEDKK